MIQLHEIIRTERTHQSIPASPSTSGSAMPTLSCVAGASAGGSSNSSGGGGGNKALVHAKVVAARNAAAFAASSASPGG